MYGLTPNAKTEKLPHGIPRNQTEHVQEGHILKVVQNFRIYTRHCNRGPNAENKNDEDRK